MKSLFIQAAIKAFIAVNILYITVPTLALVQAKCSELFHETQKQLLVFDVTNKQRSLKELEPIFKNLFAGESVRISIPDKTQLQIFLNEPPYRVRHSEKKVDYFPYDLKRSTTDDEKYTDDRLRAMQNLFFKLEYLQKGQRRLEDVWGNHYFDGMIFSLSPAAAESGRLFQHPEHLLSIIDRVNRLGRFPILVHEKNGSITITTEHLFSVFKRQGRRTLKLFRGHNLFDYFFYRLLLGDHKDVESIRLKFADWLEANKIEMKYERKVSELDYDLLENIIGLLRKKDVGIETVMSELVPKLTSSAMFTSMTNKTSGRWTEQKPYSEILELSLDLASMPEWYIRQVTYGADLEVEVVFPFATSDQRYALRKSLSIVTNNSL